MALNSRDRGKFLRSIARWLAGLKPVFGKRHYFEKYSTAKCVMRKLGAFRGLNTCPFCGKIFNRVATLVSHILKYSIFFLT